MNETDPPISSLPSDERLRLEARLLAAVAKRRTASIEPVSGNAPLSLEQERLWFLAQLEPYSPVYNIFEMRRLQGPLQIDRLHAAVTHLTARHESLRTGLQLFDGVPLQVVHDAFAADLPLIDLAHLDAAARQLQLDDIAERLQNHIFDLSQAPLWRLQLVRLAPDDHVLLFVIHHIISDGWSNAIFWQELRHLYADLSAGDSAQPLPSLPITFKDYAVWQRRQLRNERLPRLLDYWRANLDGLQPLELPTDRPRPTLMSAAGGRVHFSLPPTLYQQLRALALANGATQFMVLLAAFQQLLRRYSGQNDIAVGSPVANRARVETENVIGFFVNTLTLRTRFSGDPTFSELLVQVRTTVLDALQHQALPFAKLVAELQPQRALNRNPLFDVAFALLNVPDVKRSFSDIVETPLQAPSGPAKFDISVMLHVEDETLKGSVSFSKDLFDRPTIERMLGHYETLLQAIVQTPNRPLSLLPIIGVAERQQLRQWNDTSRPYPSEQTVAALFAQQAARMPKRIALRFGDQKLSYETLEQQANGLAQRLCRLGVGRGDVVALCAERSPQMVVALLAILKAGGAYLPLAPDYPSERLRYMLEDSGASLLLTGADVHANLPTGELPTLSLDDCDWQPVEKPPTVTGRAEDLAYIMYTSGSTGRPKGVCVTQRNVVSLVRGTDYINFTPDEIFLQLAPISFDAATFEVWGSLLNGACLVIMPPSTPTLTELAQTLVDYQITTLWLTAGLFHLMVDEQLAALRGVPQLLAGGDVLSVAHVKRLLADYGGRFVNGYGPTETTTFACCYPLQGGQPVDRGLPIGKPIANTQIYILDEQQQQQPIGVSGELAIAGAGVAQGYRNNPQLTAERFIDNPFGEGKLYRTGDRARLLADGNIAFLGRSDDQVKVRGFRVELGEIETQLTTHQAVQAAVVTAERRQSGDGERTLVAYVVAAAEPAALHAHLRTRLPAYMLPAHIVTLAQLPLTANGKVDRRALPNPTAPSPPQRRPPVTVRQHQLAAIWQELFAATEIGLDDDFFALGGHSLLMMRLLARVEALFSVKLSLARLFEQPTLRRLDQLVANAAHSDDEAVDVRPQRSQNFDSGRRFFPFIQSSDRRLLQLGHVIFETLPSPLDERLIGWLTARSFVQNRLLDYRPQLIRRWLMTLDGDHDREAVLARSLCYGYLKYFRLAVWGRRDPTSIGRKRKRLTIDGYQRVEQLRAQENGVIIVTYHTILDMWRQLLPPSDRTIFRIYGEHVRLRQTQHGYVQQLEAARIALTRNGVVTIAADGHGGSSPGVERAFHGRRRLFRTGFAELALLCHAPLVPLTATIDDQGHVTFRYGEAFDTGAEQLSHHDRVAHLVDQFATLLAHAWQTEPWLIPIHEMEYHLSCQPIDGPLSSVQSI